MRLEPNPIDLMAPGQRRLLVQLELKCDADSLEDLLVRIGGTANEPQLPFLDPVLLSPRAHKPRISFHPRCFRENSNSMVGTAISCLGVPE
jgi:hypothetical protein